MRISEDAAHRGLRLLGGQDCADAEALVAEATRDWPWWRWLGIVLSHPREFWLGLVAGARDPYDWGRP